MRLLLILVTSLYVIGSLQAQSSYRNRTPVESYLLTALDFISQHSYYKDRINWDTHYDNMLAELDNVAPDDIEEAYPLIQDTLARLDDSHSMFISPRQADNLLSDTQESTGYRYTDNDRIFLVYPDSPAAEAGIEVGDEIVDFQDEQDRQNETITLRRPDNSLYSVTLEPKSFTVRPWQTNLTQRFDNCIAYIESHHIPSDELADDYIATMWQAMTTLENDMSICGWIVDLRRNTGGRIAPTLLGIAPLVGERTFFQEMFPQSQKTWIYRDEAMYVNNQIQLGAPPRETPPDLNTTLPLVVLTGAQTGSAGEMALMAFKERSNVYIIGEETAGAATRLSWRNMNDGAWLAVSVARLADSQGNIYDLSLQPDEVIPVQWDIFGTSDDPAIQAALNWITVQNDS